MKKLVALALAAVSVVAIAAPPAEAWQIGPVIKGRNYSVGIAGPLQRGGAGPWFAFPTTGRGHIHYVTLRTGPLDRAREMTIRYRVDASPRTRFVAQESGANGTFGLAFQRAGDNWSAKGRYETYRWYSPVIVPIEPGVHTFKARFDDPRWKAVMSTTAAGNPAAFAAALAQTESVSLTFGGPGGRGHGVYATAPATFTILDFSIN